MECYNTSMSTPSFQIISCQEWSTDYKCNACGAIFNVADDSDHAITANKGHVCATSVGVAAVAASDPSTPSFLADLTEIGVNIADVVISAKRTAIEHGASAVEHVSSAGSTLADVIGTVGDTIGSVAEGVGSFAEGAGEAIGGIAEGAGEIIGALLD